MSLTEINKQHLYTVDQVFEEGSQQHLLITLPCSKKSVRVSGDEPEGIVKYANEMILKEIEKERVVAPYRNAVEKLSTLCLTQDGSGARAAAQVLLSTFNSQWFHVEIVDLCNLDAKNFNYAMDLIKGRVMVMEEPHRMIENGDEIFARLWDRWAHLGVDERYKNHYEE